jgi:hypothetical protein
MSFGRCASTTVVKGVAGLVVAVVGAVAAMGGMGITVVAMDYKETVIIDNHHGWSENSRPFLLPCTNLWLTL